MTTDEALSLIKEALELTKAGSSENVTMETDLVGDEIVDSLDSMNFLFELESAIGYPLSKIDESFDDFRVKTLAEMIVSEKS